MSLVGVSDPSLRAVEEYYIAYFGRPGDVPGATFWGSAVDAAGGPTTTAGIAVLANIAADFSGSPEYTAFTAGKSNAALVAAIYSNLHLAADATGQAWWADQLNNPNSGLTIDNAVIQILNAARNNTGTDDAQAINNLTDVAVKFTSELSVSPDDSAQYITDNFQQGFGVISSTNHDEELDYTIAHTGEVTAVGTTGVDGLVNGVRVVDDTIVGFDFNDLISGLSGNDNLSGLGGDDTIFGQSGIDHISGGEGADLLYGGDGDDHVDGNNGNDLIRGENGDDHLDGGNGDDSVFGDAGNDVVIGNTGRDFLSGGTGDDILSGGSENDVLHGDWGTDTLNGGAGHDILHGGINWIDTNDDGAHDADEVPTYDILSGGTGGDDFVFTGDLHTGGTAQYDFGSDSHMHNAGSTFAGITDVTGLDFLDRIVDLDLGSVSSNAVVDQINTGYIFANGVRATEVASDVTFAAVTDSASLQVAFAAAAANNLVVNGDFLYATIITSTVDGKSYLAVDDEQNAIATLDIDSDLVIEITGYQGTLDISDFIA